MTRSGKPAEDVWASRITGTGVARPVDLMANPDNWRTHPPHQRRSLVALLDRVGWVQNVIVNAKTDRIVDGHLRVELALERKEAAVPVVYVELTPEEEALVLAMLDEITSMAETDTEAFDLLVDRMDAETSQLVAAMYEDMPSPEEEVSFKAKKKNPIVTCPDCGKRFDPAKTDKARKPRRKETST